MFMNNTQQSIQLAVEYLRKVTLPASGLDLLIQYGVPIIQTLVLLGGAMAGIYKYYAVKNREINEKMLGEVYAPLYQYFVKQELFCYVTKMQRDHGDSPILEFTSEKRKEKVSFGEQPQHTVSVSSESIIGLNRNEFLKVLDTVNIGLASKELLTLLNMYKVLVYIEGKADRTSDMYLDSTIMKVDVEKALREEIIKGYILYHKKLKLDVITTNTLYKIEGDHIEFTYDVDEKTKEKLIKEMRKEPNKF